MRNESFLPGRFFLLAVFLAALIIGAAAPAFAVTCHCFRDRSFDPAKPQAVEPYLRATASNSLLSAVYGVPKGNLVRSLMGGTPGPDLWVAHYLAAELKTDPGVLLEGRAEGKSWPKVLAGYPLPEKTKQLVMAWGDNGEKLAGALVREVLLKDLKADPADLSEAERNTGSYQETVLAVLASRWAKRPAGVLAAEVKAGKTTWGALLDGAGVAPDQIDTRLPELLSENK